VFHDGTLAVGSASTLHIARGYELPTVLTFGDGGTLHMLGLGTLDVLGQLELTTGGDRLLLTDT
jgi:hypothetical protein